MVPFEVTHHAYMPDVVQYYALVAVAALGVVIFVVSAVKFKLRGDFVEFTIT